MGATYIEAERTEVALPLELGVNNGGGVAGLTVVVAVRDANTTGSWLDFADATFKSAGWVTRQASLAEVSAANAPGQYRRLLDVSAITNLPAGPARLVAEYDISGAVVANTFDVIMLAGNVFDAAAPGDAMDLVVDAVDAAAIATDAIDADAIAAGAIGAVEAPNLDTAVSTRSSHSAGDVNVALTASHGAGSWQSASASDWSATERENIRDALGVVGTKTAATGGQLQGVRADLDAIKLRVDGELVDVATFLGVVLGTPAVHTPTTITAGAFSWTVGVVGSTVTITRTT